MDGKGHHFPKSDFSRLAHHGAVSRSQLLTAGFSAEQIRHAVRTGRLHRIHAGVYAVGRPLTTPLEQAAAAVLACGERSALGALSALALADLVPWPRVPVVLVARRVRRPGIEIHFTDSLRRGDVHLRRGIRTTTVQRALLDAAPAMTEQQLRRAVGAALRRRRTSRTKLRDLLARCPGHRGAKPLGALVAQQRDTRSAFEDDFLTFCTRHGLPTPQTLATPFGYEVDAWFPEERVIVELDGEEFHQDTFLSDHERDLHHAALDVLTVRLVWDHLDARPLQTAARLDAILAGRRAQAS